MTNSLYEVTCYVTPEDLHRIEHNDSVVVDGELFSGAEIITVLMGIDKTEVPVDKANKIRKYIKIVDEITTLPTMSEFVKWYIEWQERQRQNDE